MRQTHPEYIYKEATLNPTNPRNRATDWEPDIIQQFRNNRGTREIVGEQNTPTGKSLYLARPVAIKDANCIACHDTADMAPASMIKLHGRANGFGWKLNEIVGSQVVPVPFSVPLATDPVLYLPGPVFYLPTRRHQGTAIKDWAGQETQGRRLSEARADW